MQNFIWQIDKRFEILSGLCLAYIKLNPEKKEFFYWIKDPDSEYAKKFIQKLHIEKYPEILDFLDYITDCDVYSKLFLYFDNDMNLDRDVPITEAFAGKSEKDFGNLVHTLYVNENLEAFFESYRSTFHSICKSILEENSFQIDISTLGNFYNISNFTYYIVFSSLLIGGFGFSKESELFYVRGLNYQVGRYFIRREQFAICLFHEFSHPYINPLADKYFSLFNSIDSLYKEALEMQLPNCYHNPKTLLYEYFVRANSIVLSTPYVKEKKLQEEICWYKDIGFIYIDSLISLILTKRETYETYEEFFKNEAIAFFNNLHMIHKI